MKRAFALLALIVSACASGPSAPIDYGGRAQPAPSAAPPSNAPAQRTAAAPNWAAGEGTPLSTYALQPSDIDPANLPRTHRVRAGETLYDIAATYQVPLRALIDQNNLQPPYALPPGRELQLPPPRFHVVARGERFAEIAARYNVDTRSLALLNRMQPPYDVRAGQRIVLPAMARAYEASAPAPSAPASRPAPNAPAAAGRFVWPLRGEIVARFGAQPGGQRLDGIEIGGREGAPVVAAADGDVVYAGNDLAAYGYLVIVSHTDGYVTAYGFNRSASVREGQRVRAGQTIAELGARPDGRARLLFQVRSGGAPVDPAPLLGISH
jgi:murein DD-endopeptidase MepM/ murein hydrolase activator NlpD